MRTVSFCEPVVRNILNRNFVNTFTNTTGDPTAGQSIEHSPNSPSGNCIRGNGKQNVQTIFLTPAGEIFHVATGFLSGQDLANESKFALALFKEMKKSGSDSTLVVDAHRKRLDEEGFAENEINARNPFSQMAMMGMPGSNGSGTKSMNGPGKTVDPQQMFGSFVKRQFLEDNQFSMRNPMMNWQQLEADPTKLVGNGKSFFSSSSSGSNFK